MKFKYSMLMALCFFSYPLLAEEFSVGQVQLCDGTEALGSEGQGMAVSAFINYSVEKNYETNSLTKKCELGAVLAFEYGNDRGFKLGKSIPFNVFPVPTGKTICSVIEENAEIFLTLTKAQGKNSKAASKILVNRCKLTTSGF